MAPEAEGVVPTGVEEVVLVAPGVVGLGVRVTVGVRLGLGVRVEVGVRVGVRVGG